MILILNHILICKQKIVNNNEMMMMSQSQPFQQPATSDMTSEMSRIASKDLSNIFHLKRSDSYFMSDELRSELIRKNIIAMSVAPQDVIMRKINKNKLFITNSYSKLINHY